MSAVMLQVCCRCSMIGAWLYNHMQHCSTAFCSSTWRMHVHLGWLEAWQLWPPRLSRVRSKAALCATGVCFVQGSDGPVPHPYKEVPGSVLVLGLQVP